MSNGVENLLFANLNYADIYSLFDSVQHKRNEFLKRFEFVIDAAQNENRDDEFFQILLARQIFVHRNETFKTRQHHQSEQFAVFLAVPIHFADGINFVLFAEIFLELYRQVFVN